MWLAVLSDQLRVVGLVGRYPTNYLIRNRPLPDRRTFERHTMRCGDVTRYYPPFRTAIPESGVH